MDIETSEAHKESMKPCIEGTQENCEQLIEGYIESLIDSLNEIFLGLHLFNAAKFFNPCYYPEEHHIHEKN